MAAKVLASIPAVNLIATKAMSSIFIVGSIEIALEMLEWGQELITFFFYKMHGQSKYVSCLK